MTRETRHDTPFFRLVRWGSRWSLRWGVLWGLGVASLSVFIPGLDTGLNREPHRPGSNTGSNTGANTATAPSPTARIGGGGQVQHAPTSRHARHAGHVLEALVPGAVYLWAGEMQRYEQDGQVLRFYFETLQTSFDPLKPSVPSQWTAGKTRLHYQRNPATGQEGDLFISSERMAAQDATLSLTGETEVQLRIQNASPADAASSPTTPQNAMLRAFLAPARSSEKTGKPEDLTGTLSGTHFEYHIQNRILWALGPVFVTAPGYQLEAEEGLKLKPQAKPQAQAQVQTQAGGVLETLGTTRFSGPEIDLQAQEGLLLRTGTGETAEQTAPQGPGLAAGSGLLIQMQGVSTACFGRGVYPEEDNSGLQPRRAPGRTSGCPQTPSGVESSSQALFLTAQNALKLEAAHGVFYDRNKREIITSGPTVLEAGPYRLQAGELRLTHSSDPGEGGDGIDGAGETSGEASGEASIQTGFLSGGVRLESESMVMTTPQMEISFPDSRLVLAAGGTEIHVHGSRFWTPDSVSFDGQRASLWFPGRVTLEHGVYRLTGRAVAVKWQPQGAPQGAPQAATGAQKSLFSLPEPSRLLELRMAGPVVLEGPDLNLKGQELVLDFEKNSVELCGDAEAVYQAQRLSGTCLVYDFASGRFQISEQVKGLFFLD